MIIYVKINYRLFLDRTIVASLSLPFESVKMRQLTKKSLNKIVEAMKKNDWNPVTLGLLTHQIYDKIRKFQVPVLFSRYPYQDNRS